MSRSRCWLALMVVAGAAAEVPPADRPQPTPTTPPAVATPLPDNQRYFNTPDDMIPYRRQEPYVRFFLDSHKHRPGVHRSRT